MSKTSEEKLEDLTELWKTSDPEVTLVEFLYATPEEYADYLTGKRTATEIVNKHDARSK